VLDRFRFHGHGSSVTYSDIGALLKLAELPLCWEATTDHKMVIDPTHATTVALGPTSPL
jgi:hypothetical protein